VHPLGSTRAAPLLCNKSRVRQTEGPLQGISSFHVGTPFAGPVQATQGNLTKIAEPRHLSNVLPVTDLSELIHAGKLEIGYIKYVGVIRSRANMRVTNDEANETNFRL